jgi:acyl-CoA synthetase (AMP-forming)/AMP-acid ligase II
MAALWMPAVNGIGVVYHPNPLDAKVISELVGNYKVTFLIATPTFLQAYMRRCSPESFGSLQYVLVGAEKLPERLHHLLGDGGMLECGPPIWKSVRCSQTTRKCRGGSTQIRLLRWSRREG